MSDSDTPTKKYYSEAVRRAVYTYRVNHREAYLEVQKRSQKKYYLNNIEARRQYAREYYHRKKAEKALQCEQT